MSECKHKATGAADWQGECPYCKLEQLEMDHVFYRLAIKERDYERERNARLQEQIDFQQDAYRDVLAERDALNHEAQNLLCIIEHLKDERDALKADAERYRWIRDNNVFSDVGLNGETIWYIDREAFSGIGFDAAIDAARGET